jgi:hypothetical protein
MEFDSFADAEIEHGGVRTHLTKESKSGNNSVIQVDQFFLGEGINIDMAHAFSSSNECLYCTENSHLAIWSERQRHAALKSDPPQKDWPYNDKTRPDSSVKAGHDSLPESNCWLGQNSWEAGLFLWLEDTLDLLEVVDVVAGDHLCEPFDGFFAALGMHSEKLALFR